MMKKDFFLSFLLFAAIQLKAEVTLPLIFGDGMVLQQKTEVNIWGFSDKDKVIVTPSWENKQYEASVSSGRWSIKIPTPKAGGPYSMTFSDGKVLEAKNILIGEVWICSGQSNMAMTLAGYGGQPVSGGFDEIVGASKYSDRIHVFSCGANEGCERELDDLPEGKWNAFSPVSAHKTSAVAFYFAKTLAESMDVPVGIICNAVGGAAIEAWMSAEMVGRVKNVDYEKIDNPRNTQARRRLARLYNMWMHPIIGYTAKGFLWYQGEYNVRTMDPVVYGDLMTEMVRSYRELWKNDKMAFFYTQIAPYVYEGKDGTSLPRFVEEQIRCLERIPYSGMAATTDVGEGNVIHYFRKDIVGRRLAYIALSRSYGVLPQKSVPDGPFLCNVEFEGGKATVTSKGAFGGLRIGLPVKGFELAGKDKVFHKAEAEFGRDRTHITVSCPQVPEPIALRYAFRNYPEEATLVSGSGIPVFPFRTDDWED